MSELMHNNLVTCPNCGEETVNYPDCVLCGHSLQDPDVPPRDVAEDDIQKMMMEAKLNELQVKRALLYSDDWDHAPWMERLQTLAQIAPDNAKVHCYIGQAYIELGECRKAIVSLTRALALDPTLAEAMRLRGDCQNALVPVMGDAQVYYDRAIADYEAALQVEPDAYTYNAHASIISSLGQWDEAIEEYGQAIELDPDYPELYFNRGYTYKIIGETEQAIADFEQFLNFETHWNEEMVSMAQSHIKELTEPD
jgi:tetratricopeptide (TPR) repeat protein